MSFWYSYTSLGYNTDQLTLEMLSGLQTVWHHYKIQVDFVDSIVLNNGCFLKDCCFLRYIYNELVF